MGFSCSWTVFSFDPLRTALILGCEYGCKDAVEVLLKSGIDVKAVDGLGHDAFHYARLSKNPELLAMVKSYVEKATRGQIIKMSFSCLFGIKKLTTIIRCYFSESLTPADNSKCGTFSLHLIK